MYKNNLVKYLVLFLGGGIFGWFLNSFINPIPEPFSENEIMALKAIASEPKHHLLGPKELVPKLDVYEPKSEPIQEKKEIPTNQQPVESEKSHTRIENIPSKEVSSDNYLTKEITEIQKALNKNDFFGAIKFLALKNIQNENNPQFTESYNLISNFVQIKVQNKEQNNILADIEKALGFYPGWWPLIVLKGKIFVLIGEFEEGAKNLKGELFYIKNDKVLADLIDFIRLLHKKRIEQLKEQKLPERLISYYEELIIEDSSFAPYYFELGKLYLEKKDFYSALVMFGIIISDETYGKDAAELIIQIKAMQELESSKQIVNFENKNSIEIPIVHLNDRIYVFVKLNEKLEAKFLIDTGATISLISINMANKLGYTSSQLKDLRWFQTAGGMIKNPVIKLSSLSMSNVKMQEVLVAVSKDIGDKFDGLLGMNFLSGFNFEINQDKNLLILRQK